MGNYVVHMINRKAVKILERFSTTAIVQYVKSGITQSVSLSVIRTYYPKPKESKKPQKPKFNKNNNNNQLDLEL